MKKWDCVEEVRIDGARWKTERVLSRWVLLGDGAVVMRDVHLMR